MLLGNKLLFVNFLLFILNIYLLVSPRQIKTTIHDHSVIRNHFHFDVTKAFYFDGKPRYGGKHGGVCFRPNVELGDKVFRISNNNKKEIGTVMEILWDQVRERLEIEFCANENTRIFVGEEVCVELMSQLHQQ